jgi:hypothetical protein
MPATMELIKVALMLASFVVQRFKHSLCVRRPHEYSPQIQPIIMTPGHGSYPSGHATQAFTIARLLLALQATAAANVPIPLLEQQLMAQAARIAINRTVAGVHFPVDSLVGQVLGMTLSNYFIARCGPEVPLAPPPALPLVGDWTFDGTDATIGDFNGGEFYDATNQAFVAQTFATTGNPISVNGSDLLHWLWTAAVAEWSK